ncbi:MAG TPA: hypothetical protein PKD64_07605 [Pirellulaceae bacterium]|nr:hypothetical protein [Pirellulaceae bacterium]HMO92052.1 hypothetical protein [Pirellulaceae bacterium]HMP68851.1 hypothetical protein [Pirellulaceae bacterium]
MFKFKCIFGLIVAVIFLIGCTGQSQRPTASTNEQPNRTPPGQLAAGGGGGGGTRAPSTRSSTPSFNSSVDDDDDDEPPRRNTSSQGNSRDDEVEDEDEDGDSETSDLATGTGGNRNSTSQPQNRANDGGGNWLYDSRKDLVLSAGGGSGAVTADNNRQSDQGDLGGGSSDDLAMATGGRSNNPGNTGGRANEAEAKPKTFFESAEQSFAQLRDFDGFQYLYAHALTEPEALRETPMAWFTGKSGERDSTTAFQEPRLGLRWGIGIVYKLDGDLSGDPPVIGDRVASSTATGNRRNNSSDDLGVPTPPSGGGGATIGAPPQRNLFGGGGAGATGPSNSTADAARDPFEEIIYYTGDYGKLFLERLDSRRTHQGGYYGSILAKINAKSSQIVENTPEQNQNANDQNASTSVPDDLRMIAGGPGAAPPRLGGNQSTNDNAQSDDKGGPKTGIHPGVSLVGVDNLKEILRKAKGMGIDVVAVFEVDVKHSSRTSTTTNSTRLSIYSAKNGDLIKKGKALTVANVAKGRADSRKEDPVELALDDLFGPYLDEEWRGKEFPKSLKKEHVDRRIETLIESKPNNPLPTMVEIQQYFVMDFIDRFELLNAFEALVGSSVAKDLIEGNEQAKRRALVKWLPENFQAGSSPSRSFR